MKRFAAVFLLSGLAVVGIAATGADAGERRARVVEDGPQLSQHPKSPVYRRAESAERGPQVRGYVQRRGGYSYSAADAAIDYRDTSILRDPRNFARQGGPFDNGFFFDSGIHRFNDAPYH